MLSSSTSKALAHAFQREKSRLLYDIPECVPKVLMTWLVKNVF